MGETFAFEGLHLGQATNVFQVSHRFNIRPRRTVQLLFFHQFEETVALAESGAEPEFDTLADLNTAGLLNGLSGNFVNWAPSL